MEKAKLFSKRGCTPCAEVKKFILSNTTLDYEEYDVEKHAEEAAKYGVMSVPTIVIGDKQVSGARNIIQLINETI